MAKILLVEDNEQLAEMLVERLERRGHSVLLATEQAAAFSSAKASHPDVILLDGQLRGDEDWATARALKFDDHTRDIPVIALLNNNSDEARSLAMQNGCEEVHGKPVDFGKLVQQIDAVAPPQEVEKPDAAPQELEKPDAAMEA